MLNSIKSVMRVFMTVNPTEKVNELLNASGANEEGGALESVDKMVKNYGSGIYDILTNVFFYIAVGAVIVTAILMIVHAGNVSKRGDEKAAAGWRAVGIVVGAAGVGVVIFLMTIGQSLFN